MAHVREAKQIHSWQPPGRQVGSTRPIDDNGRQRTYFSLSLISHIITVHGFTSTPVPLFDPPRSTIANHPTHSHFRVAKRRGSRSQSMRMPRHHASSPPPTSPSLPVRLLLVSQPRQPLQPFRVQLARPLARSVMHQKRFPTLFCIICEFPDPVTGPQSNVLKTQG